MKYKHLIQRNGSEFERLAGVTKAQFNKMLVVLTEAESQKIRSGRPHTFNIPKSCKKL